MHGTHNVRLVEMTVQVCDSTYCYIQLHCYVLLHPVTLLRTVTSSYTVICMIQKNVKLPGVNVEKLVVREWYEIVNKWNVNVQEQQVTEIRIFLI